MPKGYALCPEKALSKRRQTRRKTERAKIEALTKPRPRRYELDSSKILTNEEYDKLLEIIEKYKNSPEDARNILMIETLLKTGARASELLNLRVMDLRRDPSGTPLIFFRGLKNSDDREIPVKNDLFLRLLKQTVGKGPEDLLFNIGLRRLQEIWERYRPVKKRLHALRHTFAHRLYSRHKDLLLVQVALGHRSIANTLIYARYNYRMSELKRLIA